MSGVNPEEYCAVRRLNGEVLNIVNANCYMDLYMDGSCEVVQGLYQDGSFTKNEEIKEYIKHNLIAAIYKAVIKNNENEYTLNIYSIEPSPYLPLEGEIELTKSQIEVYLPIIKYFLLYGFHDIFKA